MEANTLQPQLRIGNYLEDREGNLCKVTHLGLGTIYAPALKGAVTKLPNKPIPLSEEWLLKLGFEEIYNSEYTHKFELTQDVSFEYRFEKFNNASGMTGLTYYGRLLGKIKHVHQLQNLFYSITGEELTIKE